MLFVYTKCNVKNRFQNGQKLLINILTRWVTLYIRNITSRIIIIIIIVWFRVSRRIYSVYMYRKSLYVFGLRLLISVTYYTLQYLYILQPWLVWQCDVVTCTALKWLENIVDRREERNAPIYKYALRVYSIYEFRYYAYSLPDNETQRYWHWHLIYVMCVSIR